MSNKTPKAIFKCVQVAGNICSLVPQGVVGQHTTITLKPDEYGSFQEGKFYEMTWKEITTDSKEAKDE